MIPPKPGRLPSASFPIRPKRPSRGGPFLFYLLGGNKSRLRQEFAFGKMLVRRCAAAHSRSPGNCARSSRAPYRLRLAMNCFAVRGVRPGLRISPHGRFPPAGAPFFHSLEAKSIRLNQGFASGKTLVRRTRGGPRYRNRSTVSPVLCSRKARSSSGAAPVSSSLSQSWPWFFPRMSTR